MWAKLDLQLGPAGGRRPGPPEAGGRATVEPRIYLAKICQPGPTQMRASPRISVLGESGDPCIAANGPLEDHKTVIFPGDGFPFH